jgi:protein TonB
MQASNALPSKFKNLNKWPPLAVSGLIHFAPVLVIAILQGWIAWWQSRQPEIVPIDVIEMPSVAPRALPPQARAIEKPKEAPIPKRAVFGASRRSITSDEGLTTKAGNTVAKTPDSEKLNSDDDDQLPIPTEEFMVSEMPTLLNEVRVPYPEEARKKRIEGVVIMDILVDAQGRVRQAVLVSGPGEGLNEAALQAIKSFQFKPARVEQQPVAVRIRYAYRFLLER